MTRRSTASLHVVGEERIDITALLHADVKQRDWSSVHIIADKREPVFFADVRKRMWIK